MGQAGAKGDWKLSVRKAFDNTVFFIRTHPKGVIATLCSIFGLVIVLQNTHRVPSVFLFWTIELPMIVWAIFFGGVGYLSGKGIEWAIQKRKRAKGVSEEDDA